MNKKKSIAELLDPQKLKDLALENLRTGTGSVARGFRGEFSATNDRSSWQNFLAAQAKPVYATYVEAASLGEALGISVVVTCPRSSIGKNTHVLYRAKSQDAPVIKLSYTPGHWSYHGSTSGSGNLCLYNSFVKFLKTLIRPTAMAPDSPLKSAATRRQETAVKAQQQELQKFVKENARSPQETLQELQKEQNRIKNLPKAEQEQIRKDYELALKLAREEVQKPSHQN